MSEICRSRWSTATQDVFVKMNPTWWPQNRGSVLAFPIDHYEIGKLEPLVYVLHVA